MTERQEKAIIRRKAAARHRRTINPSYNSSTATSDDDDNIQMKRKKWECFLRDKSQFWELLQSSGAFEEKNNE
jgi:hypothetical protein